VTLLEIGGEANVHDEIGGVAGCGEHTATGRGLVYGTFVVLVVGQLARMRRPEEDVWTLGVKDLRLALVQHHVVVVPSAALQEETVDIGTILWLQIWRFLQKLEVVGDLIDGDGITTGEVLQDTSQETLSEEETRNPEDCGIADVDPTLEEGESGLEIKDIGAEWF
jgi:hypothetical protein